MSNYDPEAVSVQPSARLKHELLLDEAISKYGEQPVRDVMSSVIQAYRLRADVDNPTGYLVHLTINWLNLLADAYDRQVPVPDFGLIAENFASSDSGQIYITTRDGKLFSSIYEFAHLDLEFVEDFTLGSIKDILRIYVSSHEGNLKDAMFRDDRPAIELFEREVCSARIKFAKFGLRQERLYIEKRIYFEFLKIHLYCFFGSFLYYLLWHFFSGSPLEAVSLIFCVLIHFSFFVALVCSLFHQFIPGRLLQMIFNEKSLFESIRLDPEKLTSEKRWQKHLRGLSMRRFIFQILLFYNALLILAIFNDLTTFLLFSILGGVLFFVQTDLGKDADKRRQERLARISS